MLHTTFIARASDGLILCETYDSASTAQSKINPCYTYTNTVERLKLNARDLLKRSDMFKADSNCSVDIEDHRFQ